MRQELPKRRAAHVPWTDVTGARAIRIKRSKFIALRLRNQDEWIARLSPLKRLAVALNHRLGYDDIGLNLSGLRACNAEKIAALIRKTAAEANRKA